jgi:hypothetical protein
VSELPLLLSQWKERAPIDVSDALKLLGREKAFQHPIVRRYAVETLESASDDDLLTYLLQLGQALRYEPHAPPLPPWPPSSSTEPADRLQWPTASTGSSRWRPRTSNTVRCWSS